MNWNDLISGNRRVFGLLFCLLMFGSQAFSQVESLHDRQALCLIELDVEAYESAWQVVTEIEKRGGKIAVMSSPQWIMGWVEPELQEQMATTTVIRNLFTTEQPLPIYNAEEPNSIGRYALTSYFNEVVSGRWANRELPPDPTSPLNPHGCVHPIPGGNGGGDPVTQFPSAQGTPCSHSANSEYMSGSVTVSTFFLESNGTIDQNLYSWTTGARTSIMNEITDAATIWSYTSSFYGVSSLTFNLIWYTGSQATTGYEPVTRPSTDEHLWISSAMTNVGFSGTNYFTQVHEFNYAQKTNHSTQHAYSAFVAYNGGGAPSTFTDNYSAYSYLGGPFTQLLYINGGWTPSQFHRVFGHETTHIFHAFDEYATSPTSNCSAAFNGVVNTNYHGATCNGSQSCLMVDNSYTGSGSTRKWNLCTQTPSHIGWQNLTAPPTQLSPVHSSNVPPGSVTFSWNRGGVPANIDSWIHIKNLSNGNEVCQNRGTATTFTTTLAAGFYSWTVVNGLDNWNGGYAQVEASPVWQLNVMPPDLTAGNVQLSHYPITMDDTFTASMTVTNISPVTIDANYAGFYLSTDAVWDSGDLLLGEVSIPQLTPSGAFPASVPVTLPWSVTCGSWFVLGIADNRQQVTEISEANNTAGLLLAISPPPPPIAIVSPDTVCQGEAVVLSAPDARGTVTWYEGACGGTVAGIGKSITVVPGGPVEYHVDADTLNCPTGCASVFVEVKPGPLADFSYQVDTLTVIFSDNSTDAASWAWDFGDGNTASGANPTHTYGMGGTYTVTLVVTSQNDCTDTLEVTIDLQGAGWAEPGIPGLDIKLGPNPADDSFQWIMTGDFRGVLDWELVDLVGRRVLQGRENKLSQWENRQIPTTSMQQGVYVMRIKSDQGAATLRLVIQR